MKKYTLFSFVFILSFILLGFNTQSVNAQSIVAGCQAGDNFSRTTGQPCGTTSVCNPGDLFSYLTGAPCPVNSGGGSSGGSGGGSSSGGSSGSGGVSTNPGGFLLVVGSRGEKVRQVQQILKDQGYPVGTIDGNYGKRTAREVKNFQYDNDLPQTGNVDQATWDRLLSLGGASNNGGGQLSFPVSIISPKEGEIYKAGDVMNIIWKVNKKVALKDTFRVSVNTQWHDVNSNYPGNVFLTPELSSDTRSYSWTIPNPLPAHDPYPFRIDVGLCEVPSTPIVVDGGYQSCANNYGGSVFKVNIIPSTETSSPVISGVSGPQTLNVNQQGTWTVTASDPTSGGNLSYSVRWGDETAINNAPNASSAVPAQTSTFTHSYSRAGYFNPTFTVRNSNGQSANTSISVNVGNSVDNGIYDKDYSTYFEKNFMVDNSSGNVRLLITADNWFEAYINNTLVGNDHSDWDFASVKTYDITSAVHQGLNTLRVRVTNMGVSGSNWQTNPGGLIYKIVNSSGVALASSDGSEKVAGKTGASVVSPNPLWTSIPDAKWIWESDPSGNVVPGVPTVTISSSGSDVIIEQPNPSLPATSNAIFTANVTGGSGNYKYYWDLGDKQQTNDNNPTFTNQKEQVLGARYFTPGTYTVSVYVVDSNNKTSNKSTLTVNARLSNSIISTPSITVLSPNGQDVWKVGETRQISWKTNNISSPNDKITIYIVPAGDLSKNFNLAQGISNTGSYNYVVDDPAKFSSRSSLFQVGGQFKIFVCAQTMGSLDLCSNAMSSYSETFTITAPTILPQPPTLSTSTSSVRAGEYLTLNGTNLSGSVTVFVGLYNTTINNTPSNSLSFAIPASTPIGATPVYVRTSAGTSNTVSVNITAPATTSATPTITLNTPTTSSGLDNVTTYRIGSTINFSWSGANMDGVNRIALIPINSTNGAKVIYPLNTAQDSTGSPILGNTGSLLWTVAGDPGDYRVQVRAFSNKTSSLVREALALSPGTITIVASGPTSYLNQLGLSASAISAFAPGCSSASQAYSSTTGKPCR